MREDTALLAWLRSLGGQDEPGICAVVLGEVLFGLERLPIGRRRKDLEAKSNALFAAVRCLAVPPGAAAHYARVKLSQQRRGLALDENDLWIAATALAIDATLVSRDRDFESIESIRLVLP